MELPIGELLEYMSELAQQIQEENKAMADEAKR